MFTNSKFTNSKMKCFADKVILITGAASGFGRALAHTLATNNATVIVTDLNIIACQKVVNEIEKSAGIAQAYSLDVTQVTQFEEVIEQVINQYSQIDIIINNAGIAVSGEFKDIDASTWRRITDINFLGMVYGSQVAYKYMRKQGFGQIVNVASMYGLVSSPLVSAYVATKHAVTAFSQSLRDEACDYGIKVNVICPGFIATDLFKHGTFKGLDGKQTLSVLPFSLMNVNVAAHKALTGMASNKAIIIFPRYIKTYWWLARISPNLLKPIHRVFLKIYRKKALLSNHKETS